MPPSGLRRRAPLEDHRARGPHPPRAADTEARPVAALPVRGAHAAIRAVLGWVLGPPALLGAQHADRLPRLRGRSQQALDLQALGHQGVGTFRPSCDLAYLRSSNWSWNFMSASCWVSAGVTSRLSLIFCSVVASCQRSALMSE